MKLRGLLDRPRAFYPLVFSLYPVLALWSRNRYETDFSFSLVLLLLGSLLFSAAVHLLVFLVVGKARPAALITLLLLVAFFSYGHVSGLLEAFRIGPFRLRSQKVLLTLFAAVLSLSIFLVLRSGKDFGVLTRLLNPVSAFLLVLPLVPLALFWIGGPPPGAEAGEQPALATGPGTPAGEPERDIYYIILDGYPNQAVLRDVYGYDNGDFIRKLEERGFKVGQEASSNYTTTFLSLASSLNMRYLDDLDRSRPSYDRSVPYAMIRDNAAVRFLKSRGYRVALVRSGWGPTNHLKAADAELGVFRLDEFATVFLQTTPARALNRFIAAADARGKILSGFASLESAAAAGRPTFVFAHLLIPHPPFLFDRQGNPAASTNVDMEGAVWLQKDRFLDQVVYANNRILSIIDRLLGDPQRDPLIILQGDHGPAALVSSRPDGWIRPDARMMVERLGILLAARLPTPDAAAPVSGLRSPVNLFRQVFNAYFGTDLELLEDRFHYSSYKQPYQWRDVTGEIQAYYAAD